VNRANAATLAPPRAPGERRVLVLCDAYWSPNGGTEGQLRHLLARLPAPWRAELWILHESRWLAENPFPCPSRSLEVGPLARLGRWFDVRRLAKEVRAGGFDLIHTYMGDSSVLGPLVGARAGVPVLVSRRDLGFWHTPRVLQALRRTGRLAAGYLSNGEAVKRHVVDVEHAPPDDVAVVRNGQDLAAFDPPRDPTARARLGIPATARLGGLLANLKPLKRQPDLVAAVALLAPKHPDLHVLFLGEGDTAPLLDRARALGVAVRVHVQQATGGSAALV
jgi:glycosyltransferase involved in cell wall biosynthesis